jgi:hypothetical protein
MSTCSGGACRYQIIVRGGCRDMLAAAVRPGRLDAVEGVWRSGAVGGDQGVAE